MQELTFSLDVSRKVWLERWGARSINSLELAQKSLKYFDKYVKLLKVSEEDLIRQLKKVSQQPEFYQFLDNIVQFMVQNKLSPRTVRTYFMFVKSYLRSKGFRIYNEDIKQFCKLPVIIKETRIAVTMEDIAKLYNAAKPKMMAKLSFLVSSGARLGEVLQLKHSDIRGNKVTIRAENTKTKAERITYISEQAKNDLAKYVKGKGQDAYVFVRKFAPAISVQQAEAEFSLIRDKCSLTKRYRLSRYHHVTIHRLRAFCKTMASEVCGKDFAEGLVGHEGYLSTYYALPETQRYEKYKLLEPKLTIPVIR